MTSAASITDSLSDWACRFARGDRNAFACLHRKYASLALAYLKPRCRGVLSADDVAQGAWLRAWQSRESFDGENFQAWFFQIVRNVLISEYRKKRPGQLPEEMDVVELLEEERRDELTALRDCLQSIDGDFVAVLRAQLDGCSTSEIAIQFKIAEKTVYTRVSRAKEQLRSCVEKKLS
jgi:RNA polymerase sigma-70 factor (ECF subfamily)